MIGQAIEGSIGYLNRWIAAAGTLVAISVVFWSVFGFFADQKQAIEAGRKRIDGLEKQVADLQTQIANRSDRRSDPTIRGEPGRQGERGPPGPQGAPGEPGPPGPAPSTADLTRIVDQRIAMRGSPSVVSGLRSINTPASPSLITGCVAVSGLHTNSVILVDGKTEFCSDTGALIGRILKVDQGGEGAVYVRDAKSGQSGFCYYASSCSWKFLDGKAFTVEKVVSRDDKLVAQLRFKDTNQ